MELQRHQLVELDAAGWAEVLAGPLPAATEIHLRHWAWRRLPLVVGRQPAGLGPGRVVLGWAGPLASGRARVAVEVAAARITRGRQFPRLWSVLATLPEPARAALEAACSAWSLLHVAPRVFGSHGWQHLSGLRYVHAASDLDLWLPVHDLTQADRVVAVLQSQPDAAPRLDGELVFPDGAAVAWREYAAWREGRTRDLLVKRLRSVALEPGIGWPPCAACA